MNNQGFKVERMELVESSGLEVTLAFGSTLSNLVITCSP